MFNITLCAVPGSVASVFVKESQFNIQSHGIEWEGGALEKIVPIRKRHLPPLSFFPILPDNSPNRLFGFPRRTNDDGRMNFTPKTTEKNMYLPVYVIYVTSKN